MQKIEREITESFTVNKIRKDKQLLLSHGFGDELIIDKQGSAELIEVLQEWVNENY